MLSKRNNSRRNWRRRNGM